MNLNSEGQHRIEQEAYTRGWNEEREYLGRLLMRDGLRPTMSRALQVIANQRDARDAYLVGCRHAAEEWLDETKGI